MTQNIRALKAKKAEAHKTASHLLDQAAQEGRDLTAEEQASFDEHKALIQGLNAQIERAEFLASEAAGLGGIDLPAAAVISVTDNVTADPKRGFKSFGEFAQSVKAAGVPGIRPDQRLAGAPSTYGNESTGADGGYAVPPEFSREIFRLSLGEDSLIPMTDNTNVGGNSMVFPKDETTPWGTDGIRAYWQAEASTATATKPKLGTTVLRLHKLMGLVPLTDELIADTNALDSYLPSKVGDSIRWKSNESILFGTGAGQPQGLLSSGAAISVAKETGQAAATVNIQNLSNMLARLMPGSLSSAVWMIHPSVIPQLFQLTLGNYPIFLPIGAGAGGAQSQGLAFQLMGRPVMVTQHASALGTVGDISLLDLSYYRTITKASGVETATSMHLYFDADATAFRAIFRLDGQSKIAAPVSPAKGSATLSPFVQLATRA
jgi:HK97 family phage major capsid protein